jgi:hypothetical protein
VAVLRGQQQARRGYEELIGGRVQKGAEFRNLFFSSSVETIDCVTGRHNKKDKGRSIPHHVAHRLAERSIIYLQHKADKRNYQEYPHNRDATGPAQFHNDCITGKSGFGKRFRSSGIKLIDGGCGGGIIRVLVEKQK